MLENIKQLLDSKSTVDEYQINVLKDTSKELFFIKDELQMTRGKDVTFITVTVYKNFEIDGKKYKGSSSTKVSPTNTIEEIEEKIDMALLSASFVKNEYYDLVTPTKDIAPKTSSVFNEGNTTEHIANLVQDLFSEDKDELAFINSCEFFIHNRNSRVVNSNGLDISYDHNYGEIELITEASSDKEEVELFDVLVFSDYDPLWIKETVKESLFKTKTRTKAIPLPKLENIPVVLTGEAVKNFFDYYIAKSSAQLIYQGIFQSKIGDIVQKGTITGDKVTITLTPEIKNSTQSKYYDNDGFFLQETNIIKDGVLTNLTSSKRFADYLDLTPTGNIGNVVVKTGNTTVEDLKKGEYLELLSFSDFQMDPLTGNFGGEIRLGIYHNGNESTPVTLGSISGLANLVEETMLFSKEEQRINNFVGPKIIKLNNISIAGNE